MAQEVLTGLTGSITFEDGSSELIQRLASIDITTGQALFDVSAYGTGNYVERVSGIKDLAGEAVGFLVAGESGNNPFSLVDNVDNMEILFKTGCSISFPAVIGNVRIVGAFAGLNVVTFSWAKAPGADPTVAWDES